MERGRFTAEFKREAVRLAKQPGSSRARVAQELGLNAIGTMDFFDEVEVFHARVVDGEFAV
jgi:hypothetical protein